MEGLQIGDLVELRAGAYTTYLGPDEPAWPYMTPTPVMDGDEIIHKPKLSPYQRQHKYKALIRHPLNEPLVGIYLGWRWRATGYFWSGGYDEPPSLQQDKRHKVCCAAPLGDDYYTEPFECLPTDIALLEEGAGHGTPS